MHKTVKIFFKKADKLLVHNREIERVSKAECFGEYSRSQCGEKKSIRLKKNWEKLSVHYEIMYVFNATKPSMIEHLTPKIS